MAETDSERVDRALRLAESRVRRDTVVDNRLDGHDRRLAAINGQLERGANATETLTERIASLSINVTDLRGDLLTKAKVDEALRTSAELTLRQQITRREFWLGVAVLVVTILSVAVQAGLI